MATTLKAVRELGAWMRAEGVKRLKLPNGTEIEMGDPVRESKDRPEPTPAEIAEAARERRDKILLGSSSVKFVRRVPPVTAVK